MSFCTTKTPMRLNKIKTDENIYNVYAIPDDVVNLYREFELEPKLNLK